MLLKNYKVVVAVFIYKFQTNGKSTIHTQNPKSPKERRVSIFCIKITHGAHLIQCRSMTWQEQKIFVKYDNVSETSYIICTFMLDARAHQDWPHQNWCQQNRFYHLIRIEPQTAVDNVVICISK